MTGRSLLPIQIFFLFALASAFASAEVENESSVTKTPKFIAKLFRKLFDERGTLKEKREATEKRKIKVEPKSAKKQVVNAIHIGPHLGPPQGSIGTGYFGDAGFPLPIPAVLPPGHRSDIQKEKDDSQKKAGEQDNQKRWWPYGLGYGPFAHHGTGHGYGYSFVPYGYGSGFPQYGPWWVRCEVPKGKGKSAKRCFGYEGFGGFGLGGFGFGGYGLGYPGFGGYFPGFADRLIYSSVPWQKSAKKSSSKRWFGGSFGYGGLGLGLGLGFGGHNQLIGYPGYGYALGHYGGSNFFPYGFCKSGVPSGKAKGKGKSFSKKRCFGSYLGVPGFGYGLGFGGGIPGYGLGFGLGYGIGYPGHGYPFGFYKSQVPKCKKNDKRCLHGFQYPYGLYPAFGCSSALCPGYGGFGLSGNMWGLSGPFYPGGYPHGFYRSKLPKNKDSNKKVERKQVIGFHPGIYAGVTGMFYPSRSPSSYSYGFPLSYGVPVYGGMIPFRYYRSEVPHVKKASKDETGKSRDEIDDPFDFLERRQVIGPALGGSLQGDGQGLGIGYPGAANLIQPGIAGVGDYGLGGGYSGVPLGLGNTGFGGYGMGSFGGLGPGLSSAYGGDLSEGGFFAPHRSVVPSFVPAGDDQIEEDSSESSESYQAKRQSVPYPVQHVVGAPQLPFVQPAPVPLQSLPIAREATAAAISPIAQPALHPFAPYAVAPTRNIHVGSPHVKVDVQTTRSNIEEAENVEKRSTDGENLVLSKRQVSPIFTPVAAEPAAVPPVRYPVPPADAYPFGAGGAWPSASVPSNTGHPPFVWSRSTLPGMLVPRGIMGGLGGMGGMGGMAGMGGGPMGGGMEMGGGMGGGLGALLGGGMGGGMGGGIGGGMGGGMGEMAGGLGALMGGGGGGGMQGMGMGGLPGMGAPSMLGGMGGLGGAGGEAMMDQSPMAGFSAGAGGGDGALSAALPGATSMPGISGVQKKSGVPAKGKGNGKKTKSKKHTKN